MRVVVTGGAGFLGTHLIRALLNRGDEVICVDNFITGTQDNIRNFKSEKFQLVEADICNQFKIKGTVDFVFHLASPTSPHDYLEHPIFTLKTGAWGTTNALNLALDKQAGFLLSSTSEVYGDPVVNPQPESYWGNVNPIGPRSVYDEAKRYAEAVTMAYHRKYNLNSYIIRIFNTYGPRMRLNDGRAIPNFFKKAFTNQDIIIYGDGQQTRSFCYVDDLIKGLVKLSNSNYHLPVNIGNPMETSILNLAKTIIRLTNSRSKIIFEKSLTDDPKVRKPDITKARKMLDWEPGIGLNQGLELTRDSFIREQQK
ncbi:MAG: GDP-mannose 4,6-dehydratase [bacterium]